MAAKPVVLRRRFCGNDGCGMPFFVCESCDRGQLYCGETCRYQARLRKCGEYDRKHQRSLEGRRDHADRQSAYRQRQAVEKVTDQGSTRPDESGIVRVDWIRALSVMILLMQAMLSGVGLARCRFCGRRGELAR